MKERKTRRETMADPVDLDCFGASDQGRTRKRNEDQFLVAELQKSMLVGMTSLSPEESTRLFGRTQGRLLLVADGMGGAAAGEQASRIAVSSLTRFILNTMPWFIGLDEEHLQELKAELTHGLERCQKSIEAFASEHPATKGMGTTLTVAYVLWPHVYVVHVGDSRCYVYRGQELHQVTRDHTIAQQLRDTGVKLGPNTRLGNVLWNVIGGGSSELSPEVYRLEMEVGDTLLLCTDGLNRHVADDAIAELLAQELSATETCHELIAAANNGGGTDNATVVVARFNPRRQAEARRLVAAEKVSD
jgi:protein phosphatase